MQKAFIKKATVATILAAGTMFSTAATAVEVSANVGMTTDYIWRGNTQASGDASFSGGLDADLGGGLAVGTWVGSLGASDDADANYELDVYASYGFDVGGVGVEVGYIYYAYPGAADDALDFEDIYVSLGYGPVSFSYYELLDAEDAGVDADEGTYLSVDYEVALPGDFTATLHYGSEEFENSADDEDTSVSISKGDFTFTVSDDEGDDTRAIVSYGLSF
jgi:uncharacterized protein (TIGR02001 family)